MTAVLLVLLVALLVFEFATGPRDASGLRPLVTAHTVVVALFAIYVVMPAFLIVINNGQYVWATSYGTSDQFNSTIGVCLAAFSAYAIGRRLLAPSSDISDQPSFRSVSLSADPDGGRAARLAAYVLVGVGLILKVYLIASQGGVQQALLQLSSDARTAAGVNTLDADAIGLRTLSGVADGAATYLAVVSLRDRSRVFWSVILLLGVLALTYMTIGKRLALILPILILGLAFARYVKRLSIAWAPVMLIGAIGIGMASLLFRILVPASVVDENIDLTQVDYSGGSVLGFYLYSLEFSTVEMMTVSIYSAHQINSMFGGTANALWTTQVLPFTYIVPRQLWADKPDAYFDISYAVSSVVHNGSLADSHLVGFASTLIGTSFVAGGLIAVLLIFLAFGAVSVRIDRYFLRSSRSPWRLASYGIVLNLLFQVFREGTLGWAFIVGVVQQLGLLVGLLIVFVVSARTAEHPDLPVAVRERTGVR